MLIPGLADRDNRALRGRCCPPILCSLAIAAGLLLASVAVARQQRPNILVILADDLGFSDLGCYGGEIDTPNLDQLAADGLRFTQFYNTGRCWPTRASLLTGYYPQAVRRDKVPGINSGGRGIRPAWAPLICQPLRQAGYRTYHTGKWHLDGMPIQNGFDLSYYLLDQHRFFNPIKHFQNDQPLDPIPKDSGYYATVALGDHAVECLQQHAARHGDQPFFHYLAFTAPHFPLHALAQDIAKYQEIYRAGWDRIRTARWRRIQQLGLVTTTLSEVMYDVGPPYPRPQDLQILGPAEVNLPIPWERLTVEQQRFQATKMAIHAAMIDCLDRQIGRVLDQLREMQQLENTVIFFLSDNGASAEIMVRGDGHDPAAAPGSWATHLCLGPGWSTVSNTPFRYHKTWNHEGGIATPLVVHWPHGIADRGQLRNQVGHVVDLWPTMLELSHAPEPLVEAPEKPGQSLVPTLAANTNRERTLWWGHEGNRALRQRDWKITAAKDGPWELYRLDIDRNETDDLSTTEPGRVNQMSRKWNRLQDQHFDRAKH